MQHRAVTRWGKYLESSLDWGSHILAGIAGLSLLTMMGMIVVNVFFRYVVGNPLVGIHDLVQLSMVVIVFFSLAYTGLKGAHIAVDLFSPALARIRPRWADMLLYRSVMLIAAVTMFWVAYLSLNRMFKSELMREASNMIGVPHYPFYGIIALGLAVYGLVLLAEAVRGQRSWSPAKETSHHGGDDDDRR